MKLKFINRNGKEEVAESLAEFIAAVQDGELSSDTLVFDEQEQRWKKASEIGPFRASFLKPALIHMNALEKQVCAGVSRGTHVTRPA